MFRRLDEGENPEAEIGRHLTRVKFANIAPVAATVDIESQRAEPRTLAVVLKFVASEGDAWGWMLGRAGRFLEGVAALPGDSAPVLAAVPHPNSVATPPAPLSNLLGEPMEASRLLGVRTAELHAALATDEGDAAFTPEPFNPMYQRALFQSMRNSLRSATGAIGRTIGSLTGHTLDMAKAVLQGESKLAASISPLRQGTLGGMRIRIHGDYHLGQVLHTGKDFIIIDFEGEPLRSIGERRIKRSPLRDVAGMIRSFDYAAWAALDRHHDLIPGGLASANATLAAAARAWSAWTAHAFTTAYMARILELNPDLLGPDTAGRDLVLRAWLLEKTCYEIVYELNSRPDWVHIPLRAAISLLGEAPVAEAQNGGAE